MPTVLLPINTFAPDAARSAPGLRECIGWVPTVRGMVTAPVAEEVVLVNSTPVSLSGVNLVINNAGNPELYAGTLTTLHVLPYSTWENVTKTGGYAGLGVLNEWRFVAFGDAVFAVRRDYAMQRRTTALFADVATAPQAALMERVGLFLIAFDIDDPGWGAYRDGWWCCGEGDATVWTPSVSAQSNRGRLYATPGPIVAAKTMGDRVVAYKENGAYLGTYDGPPKVFRWDLALGDEGAIGPNAVELVYPQGKPMHFVVGPRRMFLFDGYRAQIVGVGEVSEFFYSVLDPFLRRKVSCVAEPAKSLVHIFYATTGSTYLNQSLIYNYATGTWGAGRGVPVRSAFQKVVVRDYEYKAVPGFIDFNDARLKTITGTATQSYVSTLFTQSYGSDNEVTFVSQIRPRVETRASTYTADVSHVYSDEVNMNVVDVIPLRPLLNNRIDVQNESRWHAELMLVKGHVELSALAVNAKVVSRE